MKNRFTIAAVLNLSILVLTLFATISMMIGFQFMDNTSWDFSAANFAAFRYFTVDSNVLAGIVSLVYLLFMARQKKKNAHTADKSAQDAKIVTSAATYEHSMTLWLTLLKLAATTGVTLTMMVTVFFLAPTSSRGFFALFKNSNLFFHFLIPVLCIVSFIFFERTAKPIRFSLTLAGIIPMLVYSVYYTVNILLHLENGQPISRYDWYGFLGGKLSNIWFVMPMIYLITWIFSILLWVGNKKGASGKKF